MISIWGVDHGDVVSKGFSFAPHEIAAYRAAGVTSRGIRRGARQQAHQATFNRAVSSGQKTRAAQFASNKMQLSNANGMKRKWASGDKLHPYLQNLKNENAALGAGRGK